CAGISAAGVSGSFTVGSVNAKSINTTTGLPGGLDISSEVPDQEDADPGMKVTGSIKQFHGKPVSTPTPTGQTVSASSGGATGFVGMDHFDQRTADGG